MAEYLPLATERADDRARLEAQQRAAGVRAGDVTLYWHHRITHPMTAQEALVVYNDADKEYLSAAEVAALLSEEQAETAGWFMSFEPEA